MQDQNHHEHHELYEHYYTAISMCVITNLYCPKHETDHAEMVKRCKTWMKIGKCDKEDEEEVITRVGCCKRGPSMKNVAFGEGSSVGSNMTRTATKSSTASRSTKSSTSSRKIPKKKYSKVPVAVKIAWKIMGFVR